MVAFLPIALAAAGALAAFSRENQYKPDGQENSTGGAWLNILGGGLGGYAAGGGLSGLGGAGAAGAPSVPIGPDVAGGVGPSVAGAAGGGGLPATNFNDLLLQQGRLPPGLGLGGQLQQQQTIPNQQFLNAQRGLRYGGY